jgi:hypothetical protein
MTGIRTRVEHGTVRPYEGGRPAGQPSESEVIAS